MIKHLIYWFGYSLVEKSFTKGYEIITLKLTNEKAELAAQNKSILNEVEFLTGKLSFLCQYQPFGNGF